MKLRYLSELDMLNIKIKFNNHTIKELIKSYKHFINENNLKKCFIYPIPLNKNCLNLLSKKERIKKYFICPNDEYFLHRKIMFAKFIWINYVYNLNDIKDYFKFIDNYEKHKPFYNKNKFKITYVKKL